MKLNKLTKALTIALTGTVISLPSLAEEEKQSGLEIIEVTATKRVTTEKEIPMAIEAISGASIEKNNISDLEDMTARIPNVMINEGAQSTSVNMRGMGSGADRSFEQSVAMFIDNVYMPRSRSYRSPFFDMERVEVLRGPQSVLFGLNATAGSISIHSATTRPGDDGFVKVVGAYETEYSGIRTDVIAGTSVGDDVGVRIAIRQNDTGDGYVENLYTGEDENTTEETLARFSLVWDASENLSITTKINYADAEEKGNWGENIYPPGLAAAMGLNDDQAWDWKRWTDTGASDFLGKETGLQLDLLAVSISADYQIGDGSVTTTVSHSQSDFEQMNNVAAMSFDPEGMPLGALPGVFAPYMGDVMGGGVKEEYKQSALEVRYTSPADQTLSYVVGAYVDQGELFNESHAFVNMLLGSDPFTGTEARPMQDQDTDTVSVFASLTYNLSDDFRFIFGGRYTSQDKDYSRSNGECNLYGLNAIVDPTNADPYGYTFLAPIPNDPAEPGFKGLCGTLPGLEMDRTSENFMPEVVAQYDITDNAVVYAKVGQSVKSGGFNFSGTLDSIDNAEYDDETATGFELGYKSSFLDGNAELNVTIFHTKFEDLQLQSWITPPGSAPIGVIGNAGESESEGIEVEFNIALTDWLTMGASVATLTSEYSSFSAGPCYSGQTENVNPDGSSCDKTGETTPFAPEYSGSVYADVFAPISSNLFFTAGVDVNFSDSYYTEGSLNPAGEQDSFEKINARIGITNDDNWSVSVIAKNITEEETIGSSLPFLGMIGYTQAPRTVTIQGTYTF